ncbi:hypothetical protein FA15DRAFT_706710 [Coprinopsis marcescibilis]|uniref:UvrD-like helicase ATP-binding domain-containing protein n=1 Tax=Coprinopsis marcescibilis TaxID=230819 RepID=A0A5C3KP72_COPMA|nr:hypothetical protein FA15DRAFT_706710 [Coprinopsis marcescibilis]
MATIQGLPYDLLSSLKQQTSSVEDISCFLDDLNPTWPYTHSPELMLRELADFSPPYHHILELVLSYGSWADFLANWLLRTWPQSIVEGSIHGTVLLRLLDFFYFEGLPLETALVPSLSRDRSFVDNALKACLFLTDFCHMSSNPTGSFVVNNDGKHARKKSTQGEPKRSLAQNKKSAEDPIGLISRALNIDLPTSPEEAESTSLALVYKLKSILDKYLKILQSNRVNEVVVRLFVVASSDGAGDSARPKPTVYKINTNVDIPQNPASAIVFSQPLKAALYFDSVFGFGHWEIRIEERGIRDIRSAFKEDRKKYKIIMKKIKELSNAHFSDDNQKRLNSGGESVPVYEAKMTKDLRLVYQIDCVSEYNAEIGTRDRQVIKVFGIYTHTQLNRLWESLGYQLAGSRGREYLNRCKFRQKNREGTLVVPAVFPPEEDIVDRVTVPELPKEDLEELHQIISLGKYVTFTQELRNSILADLDVAHVFNLSPNEMEIIEHTFSCFVIGRSGTGKTTTMLFKMLGLERTFSMVEEVGSPRPRQIFVTQARILASRVEEYFMKLLSSLKVEGMTDVELKQFATSQKALTTTNANDEILVDEDDDVLWKSSLPRRFSELQDEHFPLFLTFERLVQMIAADFHANEALPLSSRRMFQSFLSTNGGMLTYPTFLTQYWPHLPQNLTRNLDPSLVFSEIVGVIKGSEESLSCTKGYLDEKEYQSLSERANYLFASQRGTIYSLFVKYMALKREQGHYDAADRTHRILEVFDSIGVPGTKVDFLYVDEAQDNMLIDAMLLRSICKNPDGLFWAGDTAQTIAIGNSFRFEDLKAFLHRLEARRDARSASGPLQPQLRPPPTFSLSTNYRSHGGIVSCAHSVIELITDLWPNSLDKMAPEKGLVDGLRPFFFSGFHSDAIKLADFLMGGHVGERIEFGARQCIIVRTEAAKLKLRQEVGDIGVILTLYDSKGLEFDDVLLYQFFEDSTVDSNRWRVLDNFSGKSPAPTFDKIRHAGLCSELKFLYVAITRARKKLWIFDTSNKAEPVKDLWMSKSLVDHFESNSWKDLPRFTVSSSCDEWKESGKKFFKNKNYSEAARCFKRAGLQRHVDIAQAYQMRKDAQKLTHHEVRRKSFNVAAEAFLECTKKATNAHEHRIFWHNVAGCFESILEFAKSANAYQEAGEHDSALKMYQKAGMFDEGVKIIKDAQERRKSMNTDVVEHFKNVAKLFYFKDKEVEKAKDLFVSQEEQLTYLEENDFLDESRAMVLEQLGRKQEAAQVHLDEGRVLDAIRLYVADGAYEKAREHIFKGLWRMLPFGSSITPGTIADVSGLLQAASGLEQSLSESDKDQIAMFRAIHDSNLSKLVVLGRHFLNRGEMASALLCFNHRFNSRVFPSVKSLVNTQLAELLADFLEVCIILRSLAENLKPEKKEIQRLFAFEPLSGSENTFSLTPGTWLLSHLVRPSSLSQHRTTFSSRELVGGLREGILKEIAATITRENEECRVALAFTPCLRYVVTGGHCRYEKCRLQHLSRQSLTEDWLIAQMRIHLQQVSICQLMESISPELGGGRGNRRFWLNRLYHTLNPPSYHLGSWSKAAISKIPEAQRSSLVIKTWCRELLNGQGGTYVELELSSIYQAAELCFHLDRQEARRYVHQSRVHERLRRERVFHRNGPNFSKIFVIPELFWSMNPSYPTFIRGGIMFVRHVLDKELSLDVNILCNFLDYLSGSAVLAYYRFSWHNIMLPRSLFQVLLRRIPPGMIQEHHFPSVAHLMDLLHRVLRLLATGENAGHLFFERKSINPVQVRSLFVPRICRTMCLIGYNIADEALRLRILTQMQPLKQLEAHSSYAQYWRATSWRDVLHAIWNSTADSPLDDLVHLWATNRPKPLNPPPRRVTRVYFNRVVDISHLLSNRSPPPPSNVSGVKQMVHNAGPMHDSTRYAPGTVMTGDDRPSKNVEDQLEDDPSSTESVEVALSSDGLDQTAGGLAAPETRPTEAISPELLAAGQVFEKAYRKLLRHRSSPKMSSREAAYHNHFELCLERSKAIQWPVGSVYKPRYLGVVPHVLLCLQLALEYLNQEKAAVKEGIKKARHTELEKAQERYENAV